MKWLGKILGRKSKEERITGCARNLVNLIRTIPLDNEDQAVRMMTTFRDKPIVRKTNNILSFDAEGSGIQGSLLFNTSGLSVIHKTYQAAYQHHQFIKFTMEAERTFISKIIIRLKEYCTAADNAGCDMLMFTGADIASIWSCLDTAKEFLAYRSILGIDGFHDEVVEFMNTIVEFMEEEDTIIIMNESVMLSDPALDAIINEMTRHYYVLGMGEMIERYSGAEWRYFDDEANEKEASGVRKEESIRITEG